MGKKSKERNMKLKKDATKRIIELADMFGVKEKIDEIKFEKKKKRIYASIFLTKDTNNHTLYIPKGEKVTDATIIHELIHIIFRNTYFASVRKHKGKHGEVAIMLFEQEVDEMSKVIARVIKGAEYENTK